MVNACGALKMDEDLYNLQRRWSESALLTIRDLLYLMQPVATYSRWTDVQQQTLGMLIGAAARSTESVLLLTSYGQLWDAELPLRSVTEATVKFAYILESLEKFESRMEEYNYALFKIALLKDDKKIRDFLDLVTDPSAPHWRPLIDRLLSNEEKIDIENAFDKQTRSSIEGRWGFTRIISSIDNSSIRNLKGLGHSYSIASHIQHADYVGVSVPYERSTRSTERERLVHITHLSRIISDAFSMFTLRLITGYKFIGADLKQLAIINEKTRPLYSECKNYYDSWLEVEY
jgi:hypothetical protein